MEGVLYYHGCGGVYAFDGSMPQRVSQALGEEEYHGAVAGGADGKYYLSVLDAENQPQLLVYDVRQGLWHREDDLRAVGFAVNGGVLYAMADCVAGIVSRTDGADYVTQSAHMNFLHNVQSGTLYAAAETVRRGHKLAIFHVTVTDEKGDLLIDGVVDMFRITP